MEFSVDVAEHIKLVMSRSKRLKECFYLPLEAELAAFLHLASMHNNLASMHNNFVVCYSILWQEIPKVKT